jgi:hypothetical protein
MQCATCYFLTIYVHLAALPDKCSQQPCRLENDFFFQFSRPILSALSFGLCPEESSQAPAKNVEAPVAATVEDKEDVANMDNTPPVVEPPSKPKYR